MQFDCTGCVYYNLALLSRHIFVTPTLRCGSESQIIRTDETRLTSAEVSLLRRHMVYTHLHCKSNAEMMNTTNLIGVRSGTVH